MRFLFVMDDPSQLNPDTDSTLEIMRECREQEIETLYCDASGLHFREGLFADCRSWGDEELERIKVDDLDLVMMRLEPPYDMGYHFVTLLLDQTSTPVVNSPRGLRDANEKLSILNFPDLIPPTLVTKEKEEIRRFIGEHKKVVVKPIDRFGGDGVRLVQSIDQIGVLEEHIILQKFLTQAYEGDKRILVLDGDFLGAFRRVPKDDFRANMALGGVPKKADLTDEDKRIIAGVRDYLREKGLHFAGLDVIDGMLLEINVTCPTGILPVNRLYDTNITKKIVDSLVQMC